MIDDLIRLGSSLVEYKAGSLDGIVGLTWLDQDDLPIPGRHFVDEEITFIGMCGNVDGQLWLWY